MAAPLRKSPADVLTLEFLTRHKEEDPTDLKELFTSYGCSTLEAKVPVVSNPVAHRIGQYNREDLLHATLELKSESSHMAMEGLHPRTKGRDLTTMQLGNETVLVAGRVRERSPVSKAALEDELETYMRETARLKAIKKAQESGQPVDFTGDLFKATVSSIKQEVKIEKPSPTRPNTSGFGRLRKESTEDLNPDVLDEELEAYMREAARKRTQRKLIANHIEQAEIMQTMDVDENIGLTPNHELDYGDDS